ncbi:hypothetical protein FQZ97_997480 [compost metagenome]
MGFGVGPFDGDFLGNGEVVAFGLFPVDQPDGLGVFADLRLHLHPIAQQLVHRLVTVIQALAGIVGSLVQLEDGPTGQISLDALLCQPTAQQLRLDIGVVRALGPVAEVLIAQLLLKQLGHALLGLFFDLANGAH